MACRRKFGAESCTAWSKYPPLSAGTGSEPSYAPRLQQEELDLGVHVAGEAQVAGLGQLAAQHVAGVRP